MFLLKALLSILIVIILQSCTTKIANVILKDEYLVAKYNDSSKTYSYYDNMGVKKFGDYFEVYTDSIKDFGIVSDSGFVLIDRTGKHIYDIFSFDNEPDFTSDGIYRITKNGKIGYADSATSRVIVEPIFDCALPFENGKAKVSYTCWNEGDVEHYIWASSEWFYIDKNGKKVKE